jgi:hypothetical protein
MSTENEKKGNEEKPLQDPKKILEVPIITSTSGTENIQNSLNMDKIETIIQSKK